MSFHSNPPNVGFVSLGCPKATVDSERILTELRAEGYRIAPSYEDADLVIVNTCGFIDAAVEESLEAIGEALDANGRVIVTGCLGAREQVVRDSHPEVLAVTGPHAYQEVMAAVHNHLPQPRDPFTSLLPPEGVKLTPHHYAYVKISEGCNHRCSFCIIPSLRGDLQSRMIGDVMQESKRLVDAGVRELLIISQDTSAYGLDVRYRTDFWEGRPLRTDIQTLARTLITSGTTLLVLLALFFLGGELIHGFAKGLLIGILVGTYSSIYIAANLLLMLNITKEDLAIPVKEGVDDPGISLP